MAKRFKRILVIGDFHCGHYAGLTHPAYHFKTNTGVKHRDNLGLLQRECWRWFTREVGKLGPIDICIANGDLVDGRGEASGGSEIICDVGEQADMATSILKRVKAKKYIQSYGTPYHTGKVVDYEKGIADRLDGVIQSHPFIEVNGVTFDIKHEPAGNSNIPHGRHTGIAKDRLWNLLWADNERQPKADVFIRSHVHYHAFCGGPDWLGVQLPALQAAHTKYGARRCVGIVDFGITHFDVFSDGSYTWQTKTAKLEHEKQTAISL